jgi:hypothetical protein
LSCDDLPGLLLWSDDPAKLMADFIPAWKKMHEIAPNQVMPIPKTRKLVRPKKETAKRRKQ